MESFVIRLMNASADSALAFRQLAAEENGSSAKIEQKACGDRFEFRFRSVHENGWTASERRKAVRQASLCSARFILQEKEDKLMRRLLSREYGYTAEEEQSEIIRCCRELPDMGSRGNGEDTPAREAGLAREIESFLKVNDCLNLDGLLCFRLRAYREELRETVEYAVDEYLKDKQYRDFIALLKYFVCIQQAKIPAVHLMHKGGSDFLLLNERMEAIDEASGGAAITMETLEKDFNCEDVIVSTLITVAPRQLTIHSRQPELPVIQTILNIFDERASLCASCSECRPLLGRNHLQAP